MLAWLADIRRVSCLQLSRDTVADDLMDLPDRPGICRGVLETPPLPVLLCTWACMIRMESSTRGSPSSGNAQPKP
jgi:hypothetical protein